MNWANQVIKTVLCLSRLLLADLRATCSIYELTVMTCNCSDCIFEASLYKGLQIAVRLVDRSDHYFVVQVPICTSLMMYICMGLLHPSVSDYMSLQQ